MRRILAAFFCSAAIVLASSAARADLLTGTSTFTLDSGQGSLSAVTVVTASGPVSTGTLSFTTDPSFTSTTTVDWDTKATSSDVHILLTSPLITSLGLTPIAVQISGPGTLAATPSVTPGSGVTFSWLVTTTASGSFSIDSVGFTYSETDVTTYTLTGDVAPAGGGLATLISGIGTTVSSKVGEFTQSGQAPQATSGTATGSISIPEPPALTLASVGGIVVIVCSWWCRRFRS